MKMKSVLLTIFISFFVIDVAADNNEILNELHKTHYGSDFFINHSKNSMLKILNFLDDPICYFKRIKKIDGFIEYIEIFDRYAAEKLNANESVLFTFLQRHFTGINKKKVDILHFLILHSDGMYGELIADKYTHLFNMYTAVFIRSLKKIQWKDVVDRLGSGNWHEFSEGINKLGKTKYENEFKEYIQSMQGNDKDGAGS